MYKFFKRCFDIFFSLLGITLLLWLFLIIAIAIKCTSKGPALFKQERVGKNGETFKIWKFRSMVVNAESKGMQITTDGDNRITKVGKFIRKTKIDELPQLFNVLSGKMSFVGPRPEVPKYVALYNEEQQKVLSVKPGITDLASIEFRNENDLLDGDEDPEKKYIEEIMPSKLALNLKYIEKAGFFYDIGLIFKTIGRVI
ncbi:MAG: sugar transferase, partial [Clostridia bacterium]|nr:sugar transferase [Clostridia bacterium]